MKEVMRLVTSQHLFFEFVPFDNKNFDSGGKYCKKSGGTWKFTRWKRAVIMRF